MVLGIIGVMTKTFEQLAQIFVLGIWPFYALTVGVVFVARRRHPDRVPVYRTWGYPVVPALFIVASIVMLLNALIRRPAQAGISAGILALGVPVYFAWRSFRARKAVVKDQP